MQIKKKLGAKEKGILMMSKTKVLTFHSPALPLAVPCWTCLLPTRSALLPTWRETIFHTAFRRRKQYYNGTRVGLAYVKQISAKTYQDERNVVVALDSQNLLSELLCRLFR